MTNAGGQAKARGADAGGAPPSANRPVIAALQGALAAEQAASYGYGIVGAHLRQRSAMQADATDDWVAHLRASDQLAKLISARGGTPTPAAIVYQLPFQVSTPAQATALAATLEDRVAQAYLSVVALTETGLRAFGAEQVRAAALRAEAWRGSTQPFPGLPPTSLRH